MFKINNFFAYWIFFDTFTNTFTLLNRAKIKIDKKIDLISQ